MSRKAPGEVIERGRKGQREGKEGEVDPKSFHHYKPPRRLILLEAIIITLLIILLLFEPNGFSAISIKGTDTVGLLSTSPAPLGLSSRSCTGGTCTSWLGAPAGGSSGASTSPTQQKRAPTDSTSASSPTSFHLQTGLAAFCSFILLLYAHIFHLLRLRTPPPLEGREDPSELRERSAQFPRKILTYQCKCDLSSAKRFGYRVSRLFTGVNVVLLLCVCISAGVQASSAGFNTGFVLLVIAWVLLCLIALMEFMNEGRKIRKALMYKQPWRPSRPFSSKRSNASQDEESDIGSRGSSRRRRSQSRRRDSSGSRP